MLIVIDTETSGLDHTSDIVTEVAWWRLDSSDCGTFIPKHDVDWVLKNGDPYALEITNYRERIAPQKQDDGTELLRLAKTLHRNTWCGANPAFDVRFLDPLFRASSFPPNFWHHRLLDVEAYGAGVLGLKYVPGLHELCQKLDVELPDHSAQGDVLATGWYLLALVEIVTKRS